MSERVESEFQTSTDAIHAELLRELELQRCGDVEQLRAHERLEIKVAAEARPGNSSELGEPAIRGVTADISRSGCRAIFRSPMRVGDVYRLRFDESRLDVPLVFARCLRCRLLREDAFETGLCFFSPIAIAVAGRSSSDDLLD